MIVVFSIYLIAISFSFAEAFLPSSSIRHSSRFFSETLTNRQANEIGGGSDNKYVVLITGCSSGIGKTAAIAFSKLPNVKVWATMRNTSAVDFSCYEERNLHIAAMDVTSEESVRSTVAHVLKEEGQVDLVINNAGYGLAGCLETVTVEEARNCFETNVWGVVRVLQAVLPSMRRRRFGYVINISSTSGIRGMPGLDYYTGSKFALEGIMDSARYSLLPFNIPITNVNVGPAVRTSFSDRIGRTERGGGAGTRKFSTEEEEEEDSTVSYLHSITNRAINLLQDACQTDVAQDSDEVASLLVRLAQNRFQVTDQKAVKEIPFNIGSGAQSNALIASLRKYPTGWGGIYDSIFASIPNNMNNTAAA